MTEFLPYRRLVRVLVGPLEEWRGGGDQKLSVVFEGDGTQKGLRIKFQVHKHSISTATPTIITIYNLSKELRQQLQKPNIQIALWVGWQNTEMTLLHTGSLLRAISHREGADISTSLMTNAAFGGFSRTIIAQTFAGGTGLKSLVSSIAKQIPGVSVDIKNINISSTKRIGNQGMSFALPANEALDKLSRSYGFSWRIENKIFYALEDKSHIGTDKVLITYKGGLLRCEPMLSGPQQQEVGVSIYSLLNPYVKPGHLVTLESNVNPDLNKDYIVHNLSHSGDTHGNTWDTYIQSYIVVG